MRTTFPWAGIGSVSISFFVSQSLGTERVKPDHSKALSDVPLRVSFFLSPPKQELSAKTRIKRARIFFIKLL